MTDSSRAETCSPRAPVEGNATASLVVSVVVPARDEAGNVGALIDEIEAALGARGGFETIIVDDASSDATASIVETMMATRRWLRLVRHPRPLGQSAALRTGVRAARGQRIASLDGDGQNDPAYLPGMLDLLEAGGASLGLVQGRRVRRRVGAFKKVQSRIANGIRSAALRDGESDSGCGLRCFRRDVFLELPFFDAVHRFMPALVRRAGYEVASCAVVDRPRLSGRSHYGFYNRAFVGLIDLLGVLWLTARVGRSAQAVEIEVERT